VEQRRFRQGEVANTRPFGESCGWVKAGEQKNYAKRDTRQSWVRRVNRTLKTHLRRKGKQLNFAKPRWGGTLVGGSRLKKKVWRF